MSTPTTAKARLLTKMDAWIEAHEGNAGVATQMNVIHARKQRDLLSQVSEDDAQAMEDAIAKKEAYDPATDKFGFGPVSVSPLDYLAFLSNEARQKLIPTDDSE